MKDNEDKSSLWCLIVEFALIKGYDSFYSSTVD